MNSASPAIPDRLAAALAGRYRFDRELGAGGMATVYLAEDVKHSRRVAIKVLKPELAAVIGGVWLRQINKSQAPPPARPGLESDAPIDEYWL